LSGLDDVIVINQHRGELTGDTRCDHGIVDRHISIAGPDVRARSENGEQNHNCESHHEEPGQNQGPARPRRGKFVEFLPVMQCSIPLLKLTVVRGRRHKVRLFVPLRLGGAYLKLGYIVCHADS
jgi:hypothetical protein